MDSGYGIIELYESEDHKHWKAVEMIKMSNTNVLELLKHLLLEYNGFLLGDEQ